MNILSISIILKANLGKSGLTLKSLVHVVKVLLYDIGYIRTLLPTKSTSALQEVSRYCVYLSSTTRITEGSPPMAHMGLCRISSRSCQL